MIKRLFAVLMIALTVTGVSAQKAKYLGWGVEAGMNFNSLSFSKADFESSNRLGFFVGPKIKVNVPILGFGADLAVLYSMNSTEVSQTVAGKEQSVSRNLSYFEIPLNLRYNFNLRVLNLYLATGPQLNYCLSGVGTLEDLYGADVQDHISRSTWGWNVGAGVELFSHLQVGLTYTIPISNNGELKPSDIPGAVFSNFKQKTVKVRLAYYF